MLREANWPEDLALRVLLTGGDVLHAAPQGKLPFDLVNHYGPTESTVVATCYPVMSGTPGPPPIGKPIANTQVYLLDGHMNPVPPGAVGEIYIGGASLARGYHRRPDLTAERFVVNPFDEVGVSRLYKTGDAARYRADGEIEFLGRLDHQVKIRGFRIELGEVETVLRQNPSVAETVVVARIDESDRQRLVAYVVCEDSEPNVERLIRFLRDRLPDYMVPTAFVVLDSLPLTVRGKLDRDALPMPEGSSHDFEAPRNERERILAELWSAVIGVDRVGIHDNFFELGGDSILSIQIISRANQEGIRLTPKQVFEYQTIARLAEVSVEGSSVVAQQGVVTGDVPLTPIQRSFFEQDLTDRNHFNQSVFLEVSPNIDPSHVREAVGHLILHHDALRARFVLDNERGWCQRVAEPNGEVPFSYVDVSKTPESERSAAIEATCVELQSGLDISNGPLVRVILFSGGDGKPGRLLIVIHHLLVDGVSWRILLDDLGHACEQLARRENVTLPSKTTSVQQWSRRLREYAQDPKVLGGRRVLEVGLVRRCVSDPPGLSGA